MVKAGLMLFTALFITAASFTPYTMLDRRPRRSILLKLVICIFGAIALGRPSLIKRCLSFILWVTGISLAIDFFLIKEIEKEGRPV